VHAAKRFVVPGKKRFQAFLGRLLAVIQGVVFMAGFGEYFRRSQVAKRLR
jgi:hypothetical protein